MRFHYRYARATWTAVSRSRTRSRSRSFSFVLVLVLVLVRVLVRSRSRSRSLSFARSLSLSASSCGAASARTRKSPESAALVFRACWMLFSLAGCETKFRNFPNQYPRLPCTLQRLGFSTIQQLNWRGGVVTLRSVVHLCASFAAQKILLSQLYRSAVWKKFCRWVMLLFLEERKKERK
jgi:hypothetical protein